MTAPTAATDANWSTHQLSGFLESVAACHTEEAAIAAANRWSAEALEAEVAAVLSNGAIIQVLGFAPGRTPAERLIAVAAGTISKVDVEGLGSLTAIAASVDELNGALVLARSGGEAFQAEEVGLLRAMARTLSMTLRNIRMLERERSMREEGELRAHENARLVALLQERQIFLERLSKIELSISRRAPLPKVLDAIVAGAHELLGDEVVILRLVDRDDPRFMTIVSSVGVSRSMLAKVRRLPLTQGAAGRSILEDRLIMFEDYQAEPHAIGEFSADNLRTAMAAPVHENGRSVGSIVVASYRQERGYTPTEREMLLAFAHHASLALNDAKAVDEMRTLAYHDALSGLPNRALFAEHLDRALANARRSDTQLAVLFMDLDRFKMVNDSLGHSVGDRLLACVGERLRRCLRASDLAARFGGDEFAVLIESASEEGAATLAEALCDVLQQPFAIDGHELTISASVGVALDRSGESSAEALLRNADLAMYKAKIDRPGHHVVFETAMHEVVSDRVQLESDLRRATALDDFEINYQPIVRLDNGQVQGVEALLRWRRDGTLVPPGDFVPVAEEMGLIGRIGRLVLRQAMEQALAWQQQYPQLRNLGVSVNLSPRQLHHSDFVNDVRDALAATGFDPTLLTLEITETALMRDLTAVRARLQRVHDLGVHFALDDFGTGYSSLTYLRQFPIDALKIDRSFVSGVCHDHHDASVTRAIVQLGESLELSTVAEGIERADQADALLKLGCTLGQGFFFAAPMDALDTERYLRLHQPEQVPGRRQPRLKPMVLPPLASTEPLLAG
jgi:diguanylate cyclase (GGDEF)-like protein